MAINLKTLNGYEFDAAALGGKAPEYYLSPRNLLDNGYFVDVVNQRGVTSASAWSYLIDRWLSFHYDSSITLDDNGLTLDVGMLVQRVPISKFRHGKEYTIALYYADGTVGVGSGIVDFGYLGQSHDFFNSTDFDCALSVRGVTAHLDFSIYKTGKAIMGAALYEGTYTADSLPPFVPRPYTVELAECQRYYYQSWGVGGIESEEGIQSALATGVYSTMPTRYFPVEMRGKPTITFYAPTQGTAGCIEHWDNDTEVAVEASRVSKVGFSAAAINGNLIKKEIYSFHFSASADL